MEEGDKKKKRGPRIKRPCVECGVLLSAARGVKEMHYNTCHPGYQLGRVVKNGTTRPVCLVCGNEIRYDREALKIHRNCKKGNGEKMESKTLGLSEDADQLAENIEDSLSSEYHRETIQENLESDRSGIKMLKSMAQSILQLTEDFESLKQENAILKKSNESLEKMNEDYRVKIVGMLDVLKD